MFALARCERERSGCTFIPIGRRLAIGKDVHYGIACHLHGQLAAGEGKQFMILGVEGALCKVVVIITAYACLLDFRCFGKQADVSRYNCTFIDLEFIAVSPSAERLPGRNSHVSNAVLVS